MTRSLDAVGLTLALLARPGLAQVATQRISPPARAHHTVFYDAARQRILMTGGTAVDRRRNYEMFNDLWSFDGRSWTQLPSSGERMSGMRVATDAHGRVYSFGGWKDSSLGVVRVLDNDRWRTIGTHPSIVSAELGFVFDAARNRFLAFGGGFGERQAVSDLWEFDGTRWSKNPATAPPARSSHAMVYDARRQRTVVVGGMSAGPGDARFLGDTWEFDGAKWVEMPGVAGPPPRLGAGAAYDSKRGLVLVFGGADEHRVFNDLWAWDGAAWKKLSETGPEPRVMGFMAYDSKRDRVVMFGGRRGSPENTDLGDTWEWDGTSWTQIGR